MSSICKLADAMVMSDSLGADKLLCKIFSGFQAKCVSLIYHNPVTPYYKCTMMESSYKNIGLSVMTAPEVSSFP